MFKIDYPKQSNTVGPYGNRTFPYGNAERTTEKRFQFTGVPDSSGHGQALFTTDRKGWEIYLVQLETVSEWAAIAGAKLGCRDPDDDKLLETALMGDADCLVTGDGDLLAMSPFHGIPVLTPAEFLERLTGR